MDCITCDTKFEHIPLSETQFKGISWCAFKTMLNSAFTFFFKKDFCGSGHNVVQRKTEISLLSH